MDNKIGRVGIAVVGYLGLTIATLVALVIMSAVAPQLATTEAWVHAVIVTIFAVVLTLRLRAARAGSTRALRAVGIIAGVLLVANAIEAVIGLFPGWMRIEMIIIAALMALILILVVQALRHPATDPAQRPVA